MFDRRRFLKTLAVAVSTPALGASRNPFTLGVASGYPTPSGVVLWTRLLGMGDAQPVQWEIADDEPMRSVVARGEAIADPAWAHSLHIEVDGLQPERWYWYRFRARDAESPVGRTRTAPRAASAPGRLRFAFASCQHYEQGWFSAYRHIAADHPDLVVFLGDYIYESSWGANHVRKQPPEPWSLDEYRLHYAVYKSDRDLQAAHAACPWIVTWDDHEVHNDYADDLSQDAIPRERFLARRTAAYRAYYEHMPLPARMRPRMEPGGPHMRIYTELDWGTLARFHVLDARQHRSYQACRRLWRKGEGKTVDVAQCPELERPTRSMLGRAQERWLEGTLADSRAAWNVIAQPTPMAQFDQKPGPGRRAWTDGWDGYPAARKRLLQTFVDRNVSNPIVIGGDVHSFNVSQLKLDFDDAASPVVASEFVGTSITSQAWSHERLAPLLADNPHILLADGRRRGYTRVEVTPKLWRSDLRVLDTVQRRESTCTTLASFAVEDGKPGPQRG
jgi:alkaline phosphatase D